MALLLLAAAAAAGAVPAASATESPKAVRASILAAANAQHSVRYVTRELVGSTLLSFTGDIAATDGRQRVSFKAGTQTGQITILVLDQIAYVQGDANGLQLLQELTKAQSAKYAGQWISIPKGDKDYNSTAASVTLGSFLKSITPHGRLAVVRAKLHGTRVIAIRATSGTGKKKRIQVLDARASGKRLPLEEVDLVPGQEYIGRTTMSNWNESVQVTAPANAVPISAVRG